jgi:hypothetical protein
MTLGVIFVKQERRLAGVNITPEQNTIVSGVVQASISFSSEGFLEIILLSCQFLTSSTLSEGDPSELELTCHDIHLSTI